MSNYGNYKIRIIATKKQRRIHLQTLSMVGMINLDYIYNNLPFWAEKRSDKSWIMYRAKYKKFIKQI